MMYNTQRPHLVIREYGRIIHKMVHAAVQEEDEQKRNVLAQAIIELMGQTNPQFKNVEEYRHKLWDHLIMISDFKLVVDSPYPFPERRSVVIGGARPLPYPKQNIRFKHLGKNLEKLVERAQQLDEEKRKELAVLVAYYMKLCYANWSREHVSDEMIRQDLKSISGGLLQLDENFRFDQAAFSKAISNNQSSGKPFRRHKQRNFGGKFKKRR